MRASWRLLLVSLAMLSNLIPFTVAQATTPPAGPGEDDGDGTLSIVTLNLWHDKGDWPARERLIVHALRELRPDVIALQEVIEHEALPNQARSIAAALGYASAFVSTDAVGKPQRYGNAILTRHRVIDASWKALAPLDDYRSIGRVRIAVGDRAINVYVTHLHWTEGGGAIRATQVADALAYIDATADGAPSLLAGDLNAAMSAPEMLPLRRRFVDAYAATHPGIADDDRAHSTLNLTQYAARHIDQILVQANAFAPIDARVILDKPGVDASGATGVWPSDHYGVLARIRMLPSPTADAARPWRDTGLTPDARAAALAARMTRDEKLRMVRTEFGMASDTFAKAPDGAIGGAGYMPGNARLGIPALQATDAGLGVTKAGIGESGATALPSGLATAASWDPHIAEAGGAMIGRQAWYPGARGGEAIARLLYGEVAPAGRLPVSWPRDETQLPRPWIEGSGYLSKAPPMDSINYDIEGANVGYKWFAAHKMQPLFPFGFGLGYTTFGYGDMAIDRVGDQLRVYADVVNTGSRDGSDVVQADLNLPQGSATPIRLIGWQTVQLAPGERRRVAITVDPRLLASVDVAGGGWRIAAGRYAVSVGGSAADTALRQDVELPALVVTPITTVPMPR